jgi:hypothetical protein
MDALERCALVVRNSETADGRMSDAVYVDVAELKEIEASLIRLNGLDPGSGRMQTLEIMGVPVLAFEIVSKNGV